jgi:uncharacterized protein
VIKGIHLKEKGNSMFNAIALPLLVLFSIVGFCAIFFTTFGTLIIFIGAIVYALITGFQIITMKVLIFLLLIYLAGELLEYIFMVIGVKKLGASNAAVVGAILGAIPGALIGATFFGIGIVLGTFLGIFLGALLVELIIRKDLFQAFKAGVGGVVGRMGSIIGKVMVACLMLWILATKLISG